MKLFRRSALRRDTHPLVLAGARRAELRDHQKELQSFQLRLGLMASVILAVFSALLLRLFYVQVIQHDYYHTLAENNRISIVPIVPNRGLILDRNSAVLAHNYAAYTLEITPSKAGKLEGLINELSEVVDITPRDRKRFRKVLDEGHDFSSAPIRTRLSDEEVARFAANKYRFPGVDIRARLFRHYPNGEVASHVLGYMGRINKRDVERLEELGVKPNYAGSDFIGKIGLEGRYEQELHGTTGFEEVETDAGGRAVRTLRSRLPISGNNLLLSLDARLQNVAEQVFGNRRGALIAIEPSTGGILALMSKPGFDPNLFVDGIDPQNWDLLNNSPDHPLNNRALQGVYPPGSTFKPFMALAALELGKRSPGYSIADPGYFSLGGSHRWRDWKQAGHGVVDLHKSIVVSCDTYYYGLAHDMGIDNIHKFVGQFGFGKRTGIDIDGEAGGLLPSEEWKMKRFKQKWYPGDTISVGIGQGYNLATPMQLAQATAVLANRGVVFRPHIVRQIQNSQSGALTSIEPQPIGHVQLASENVQRITDAMVDVLKPGGTAVVAGTGAEYRIAGKTGTAQVIGIKQNERYDERRINERHRDHALFIAYAPADAPTIAVAVLVENGGHGSSSAAPVARKVMDFYLLGKEPKLERTETVVEDSAGD
ncbi:MAG: penicillin-binding protein 2 [Burkholderiales bacterium]|nr:penicillin-binding protein 2 [Burkholderiales bacterium]